MNTFSITRDSAAVSVPDPALEALCGWRERRDEKAARRLVSQLSPLMRGIALRSLRCPWMAEDAVQTAWMRLFQSLETHELRVPPAAWAVMIIKGVCANMLRTLARRPAVALEELSEEELEDAGDKSFAGGATRSTRPLRRHHEGHLDAAPERPAHAEPFPARGCRTTCDRAACRTDRGRAAHAHLPNPLATAERDPPCAWPARS